MTLCGDGVGGGDDGEVGVVGVAGFAVPAAVAAVVFGKFFVIPAKAGIQMVACVWVLDSRFRGNDKGGIGVLAEFCGVI